MSRIGGSFFTSLRESALHLCYTYITSVPRITNRRFNRTKTSKDIYFEKSRRMYDSPHFATLKKRFQNRCSSHTLKSTGLIDLKFKTHFLFSIWQAGNSKLRVFIIIIIIYFKQLCQTLFLLSALFGIILQTLNRCQKFKKWNTYKYSTRLPRYFYILWKYFPSELE